MHQGHILGRSIFEEESCCHFPPSNAVFTLCFLRRRSCSAENRFHPLVGDASPLMWSSEDGVSGKGGSAEGWGEAQEALSMRCDALLQLTRLNYGELWWNMRDLGRIVGRDDTAAGHIRLIGEDGQIWRNGLTTAKHVLRGDKLDTNKCVCAPKESGWIPACHCTTLFCNPTDNAMLLCFFLVHEVYCGCPWSTQGRAANGLSMSGTCHFKLTHSRLPANSAWTWLFCLKNIYVHLIKTPPEELRYSMEWVVNISLRLLLMSIIGVFIWIFPIRKKWWHLSWEKLENNLLTS